MFSPVELTTLVAVDAEHVRELRLVWPTWVRHRPQLLDYPLIVICDADVSLKKWGHELAFVDHPQKRLVGWTIAGVSQREKMLSSFVFAAAEHVHTPWYLKLDTDAVALQSCPWLQSEWFEADPQGRLPVFISSPWGYTKPPDAIQRLDDWADHVPDLSRFSRLNLVPQPGSNLLSHRRIISWCFFGNTAAVRLAASYCSGKLPVPSQDTFLWYCAARRGDYYRTVRMKKYGWSHVSRYRRLKEICGEATALVDAAGESYSPPRPLMPRSSQGSSD